MSEVSKDSFTNKITINKDEFCSIIKDIEKYREDSNELNRVISNIGDGYFIFNSADKLMYIISQLLGKIMNSEENDDYLNDIDYYLFEENKKVTMDNKEYFLNTPESLYEFLIDVNSRNKEMK